VGSRGGGMMEVCYYCLEPAMDKIGCCGENHFGELYGFMCEDQSKEYPYGVEWSFDYDGNDIIDVEWFKTEEERYKFIDKEGFDMIREDFTEEESQGKVYDPPMSETEQYLLNKEREEEHKSYDY
jgi:hypothetical protein